MDNTTVHTHEFVSTVIPATCKEKGYTLHRCACGYSHKDNYVPIGDHSFAVETETAATCCEAGSRKLRCTVCDLLQEEVVAPLGHDCGEWSIQKYPSCTQPGQKLRMCKRCDFVEEEVLLPTGHDVTVAKDAKPAKGYLEGFCKNCGETVLVPTAFTKLKQQVWRYKKVITSVAAALVLIIALTVASVNWWIPGYHYLRGTALIQSGEYEEAMYHLMDCREYKDTEELLDKFKIKADIKQTIYYSLFDKSEKEEYDIEFSLRSRRGREFFAPETEEEGHTYSYYGNGSIKEEIEYYNGSDAVWSKTVYRKNGSEKQATSYDQDGSIIGVAKFSSKGYPISVVSYDSDGNVQKKEKYDTYGKMIYHIVYDEDGEVKEEGKDKYDEYGVREYQKSFFSGIGNRKIKWEYTIKEVTFNDNAQG